MKRSVCLFSKHCYLVASEASFEHPAASVRQHLPGGGLRPNVLLAVPHIHYRHLMRLRMTQESRDALLKYIGSPWAVEQVVCRLGLAFEV